MVVITYTHMRQRNTDETSQTFARRLFQAHRELEIAVGRDVTQAELGERVGAALKGAPVSQSTIYRWLQGAMLPDLVMVEALARALGVRPEWLAFGSGPQREITPEEMAARTIVHPPEEVPDHLRAMLHPPRAHPKHRRRKAG